MHARRWLRKQLLRIEARLRPSPQPVDLRPVVKELGQSPQPVDLRPVVKELGQQIVDQQRVIDFQRRDYIERQHELFEARQMQGSGPWQPNAVSESRVATAGKLRESGVPGAQGSMGDLELALQNVEWRREVNLSLLEFSRWGIQQIILISRLYYIKNPLIRRAINVDAYYVFGRGVEISSSDEATNDAIKEFLELNKSELGQCALSEHQKRTNYDGNLFFAFFADTQDKGTVKVRMIDATEIQDIITNPEDANEPWFYRRCYTVREFDQANGATRTGSREAWYPAVGYNPDVKSRLKAIQSHEIQWDTPILHRKYGTVGKWLFGCPRIYPAVDWAKAARRYLEACGTLAQTLAQYALKITTKGGQQALAGVKQQLETGVNSQGDLWDPNPSATNGSTFASGPGTTLEAFHSRGVGLDPSEVKQFVAMVAICMDLPPTFFGDLETANLATATTLDRPTELAFMHKQEEWRELLIDVVTYAMETQLRAPSGKLREALKETKDLRIIEAPRVQVHELGRSYSRYMTEGERKAGGKAKKPTDIEITVTFPSIREGDIPAMVSATVEAMTLANKGGQIVGIDEKAGVLKLFELLGIENGKEIVEEMYPADGTNKYDPNRTIEDAAAIEAPVPKAAPAPVGPQVPGGKQRAMVDKTPAQEALARLGWSVEKLRKLVERKSAA